MHPFRSSWTRQVCAEIWMLQERSAKWTNHLQELEGAVYYRQSMIDGEDRRLDELRGENKQLAMNLQQTKTDLETANAELEGLRKARGQQVEDNDFTRAASLEETCMP